MVSVLKFLGFLLISIEFVSLITSKTSSIYFMFSSSFFFLKFKVFGREPSQLYNDESDFYTAAVAEFAVLHESDSVRGNVEEALTDYLRLINEASESEADIVIFPEGSLNYHGLTTRQSLLDNAVVLHESEIHNSTSAGNVCDYSKKSSKVCG